MSLENVKRFFDTIVNDNDFRTRILEANRKYEGKTLSECELEQLMAEEFLPLLKEEGYVFTIDELELYQKERDTSSNLVETCTLENVSGGIENSSKNRALHSFFDSIFNS